MCAELLSTQYTLYVYKYMRAEKEVQRWRADQFNSMLRIIHLLLQCTLATGNYSHEPWALEYSSDVDLTSGRKYASHLKFTCALRAFET